MLGVCAEMGIYPLERWHCAIRAVLGLVRALLTLKVLRRKGVAGEHRRMF